MAQYELSDLAARFREASDEFIAFLESLDDSSWSKTTKEEGWPVGVVAHHVAVGVQFCGDLAVHAAGGGDIALTKGLVDQANAQHAQTYADIEKVVALDALSHALPEAAKKIENLPVEGLSREFETPMDFGEGPVHAAGDVVEVMMIHHINMHLASIREAVS